MSGWFSKSKREEVVCAYLERKAMDPSVSYVSISQEYGVSPASLNRWLRAYRSDERLEPLRGRGGRRSKLSTDQKKLVAEYALANPTLRIYELVAWVQEKFGISVGGPTVRRYLGEHGIAKRRLQRTTNELVPDAEKTTRYKPRHRRSPVPKPHRRGYPSDISDEEWRVLEPLISGYSKHLPMKHSLREIVDALRYISRTGCAWRYLPHDFPPHPTVRRYFDFWSRDGTFLQVNEALQRLLRLEVSKEETPSLLIIDSQTVKTTEKGGSAATTGARKWKEESDTSP